MLFLKRAFNFYINSSVHVAIAVVCLTWITFLEFDFDANNNLLWFTFFASITGYNFVKYFGISRFYHRSLATWLKYIQIFSLFSFLAMIYFGFFLSKNALLIILGLAGLTFLYAIPFFPKNFIKSNIKNLRAISGLKIYIIALVWAITVVLFPLINSEYSLDNDVLVTSFQRFLFVIVLMLPFEIRDLKNDSLKLLTIPQQIGVKRTKQIGVVVLVLVLLLEFFKDEFEVSKTVVLGVTCAVTLLFIVGSSANQRKYYSAFWVESIPIFWLILCLILL